MDKNQSISPYNTIGIMPILDGILQVGLPFSKLGTGQAVVSFGLKTSKGDADTPTTVTFYSNDETLLGDLRELCEGHAMKVMGSSEGEFTVKNVGEIPSLLTEFPRVTPLTGLPYVDPKNVEALKALIHELKPAEEACKRAVRAHDVGRVIDRETSRQYRVTDGKINTGTAPPQGRGSVR